MTRLGNLVRSLARNYKEAKAELQGVALSQARMLKGLKEILGLDAFKKQHVGPPRPTNINIMMRNGAPMTYYTDGSLRHTLSHDRRGKKARVRARRLRRAANLRAVQA